MGRSGRGRTEWLAAVERLRGGRPGSSSSGGERREKHLPTCRRPPLLLLLVLLVVEEGTKPNLGIQQTTNKNTHIFGLQ